MTATRSASPRNESDQPVVVVIQPATYLHFVFASRPGFILQHETPA